LKNCKTAFSRLGGYFDLDVNKKEIEKLETEMQKPNFWQDQDRAKIISKNFQNLRDELDAWQQLTNQVKESLELSQHALASNDQPLAAELSAELHVLHDRFSQMEFAVLFSAHYDKNSAIIVINAGTGGVEAQDWAAMLLRMYLRYCERKNFITKIVDQTDGQEAGVKSVTVEVFGRYAYGYLKSEAGVHRLVRISPFDAEKMRHTSFALVEVIPELEAQETIELKTEDLKIDVFRAGGHGGQSVNTTDSAVRITHLPSGIVVKCQNERSQLQNKQTALKLLQSKLAKLEQEAAGQKLAQIRGEVLAAAWGNQIRSYVLQPYKMVKDHRTDFSTPDANAVLDGRLDDFVESYLRYISKK